MPSEIIISQLGLIMGIISLFLALASSLVLLKLSREKEVAMSSFQLKKEEAIMDFNLLMYANLGMVLSFLVFWIGSLIGDTLLIYQNLYLSCLYGVFLCLMFFRWWRRF